jgi:hypothetical protein
MTTRAQVETVLIKRAGKLLTAAGLDGTSHVGANADLADPIGYALRTCGFTVADISNPTTAEVTSVSNADIDKLLDIAELRTCENISGNLDDVDYTLGPQSESLGQLSTKLDTKIARLREKILTDYGIGAMALNDGTKIEMGWDSDLSNATEYA